jgi:hypothetical protein
VAIQRLDIKSARYDSLSGSVLIDGRDCVVEISHEALEELQRGPLTPEGAVSKVVSEVKRLSRLATRLPADDGKIHITRQILINDGAHPRAEGS